MARNYRDLIVWQKAIEFVSAVYRTTSQFPREEVYGLTAQLRRACVSIASNIAEGEGRGTPKEFLQFLRIAYGSLREVETQLIIAERLAYLHDTELQALLDAAAEVGRLINGFASSLRRRL